MEPATPAEGSSADMPTPHLPPVAFEAQVREAFARVAYTHKTHEKAADICLSRLSRIKIWQIALSAVTTGGLLSIVFSPDTSTIAAALSALVSTGLLGLNAYTKENDLGQFAQRHKEAADKLWLIREEYLSLLTDLASGNLAISDATRRRDDLLSRLSAVYEASPRTSAAAYLEAQRALKFREDLTFAVEEIDQFLPQPLRRSSSAKKLA